MTNRWNTPTGTLYSPFVSIHNILGQVEGRTEGSTIWAFWAHGVHRSHQEKCEEKFTVIVSRKVRIHVETHQRVWKFSLAVLGYNKTSQKNWYPWKYHPLWVSSSLGKYWISTPSSDSQDSIT